MFGSHSTENLRRFFADQFEPNERGYLYRQGLKGAPVQVSAAERDAFVAEFERRMRRGQRIGIAVVLAVCVILVIVTGGKIPGWWGGATGGAVAAILLGGYWWIRNAPARALERRPALGHPRDGEEMQRVTLARMHYALFAVGYLGCVLMGGAVVAEGRPLSGWHPLALASAVLIAALLTRQLLRKRRFAREGRER